MKKILLTVLLCSQLPLQAQEVSAELRDNISELISIRAAERQRAISDSLGKAFSPDIYHEQFRQTLLGGTPVENEEKTDCPAATLMANGILKQFDPQDYDAAEVLKRMEDHLSTPAPASEEEEKRHSRNTKNWLSKCRMHTVRCSAHASMPRKRKSCAATQNEAA